MYHYCITIVLLYCITMVSQANMYHYFLQVDDEIAIETKHMKKTLKKD
jgi:hypothetical protein